MDGRSDGADGEGVRGRAAVQGRAHAKGNEIELLKDKLSDLKKAKPRDEAAIAEVESRLAALTQEVREATAKAETIENAVSDLKAVNPHCKATGDTRTPEQLLDLIEAKGREIADAVAELRCRVSVRASSESTVT